MKIQGLAVIALLIIVPMTIILSSYSKSQIQTLQNQISYDTKLNNSTYDAIKAYQLNMSNSTTSDMANSKMRDIKAAINVFYSSLASNFNMTGYGEEVLKKYVPAVVYTSYDGYYIYSAYKNEIHDLSMETDSKYSNERLYDFKPYIYYSCRYKIGNADIVITYSLDNYITIQGNNGGETIDEAGYLLSGVNEDVEGNITYKGVSILKSENGYNLKEQVYDEGKKQFKEYPQAKLNGVKWYLDEDNNQIFSMINDKKLIQSDLNNMDDTTAQNLKNRILNNPGGYEYYKEALEFRKKITERKFKFLKES